MNIQITDYGVSLLKDSKQPLKISKAVLGSSYNYTPTTTAEGIQGQEVYRTEVTGPKVINANVVKYSIGIDYEVGPFVFGEIAFLDETEKCVAIAVSDALIEKRVQTNEERGNSIRVDAYLSMVDGNFDMWIESIGSDIDFYVPTLSSVDLLPPVVNSDPNFYIIDAPSEETSATLAYAGRNGLWEFDNYFFSNVREFTIVGATARTITIDIATLDDDDARQTLVSKFFGDKVIEFNSGKLYSICRILNSVLLQSTTAVLSFGTLLAELPRVNDTLLLFSRTELSTSDLVLPIATSSTLGAIKLGEGLVGEPDGTTHVDFPVTSVNGQLGEVELSAEDINDIAQVAITGRYEDLIGKPAGYTLPVATPDVLGGVKPQANHFQVSQDGSLTLAKNYVLSVDNISADINGNVTLPQPEPVVGLISPAQIPENADLNTYTKSGIYYASDGTSFQNGPEVEANKGLTLEVVPIESLANGCMQRYTCAGHIFVRIHFLDWTDWADITASSAEGGKIASYSQLGVVYVKQGNGIQIDETGGLSAKAGAGISISDAGISANVTSVNGQTGDVTVTLQEKDLEALLELKKNVAGGIAGLTDKNRGVWESARIEMRQLPIGTFVLYGEWDASTNQTVDLDDFVNPLTFLETGYAQDTVTQEQYDLTGYVFHCSTAGNTSLNGISDWQVGDLLFSISDVGWFRLNSGVPLPKDDNQVLYSQNGKWVALPKPPAHAVLGTDADGNLTWLTELTTKKLYIV